MVITMNKKLFFTSLAALLFIFVCITFTSSGDTPVTKDKQSEGKTLYEKAIAMESELLSTPAGQEKFASMLKLSSDEKYPLAQYRYAELLLSGTGVSRNEPAALNLLEEAKREYPKSNELIGLIYLHLAGSGDIKLNVDKGVGFITQSAMSGVVTSQAMLGVFYLDGETHIPKDKLQAYYWLRRAAEQNDKVSQLLISGLVGEGFEVPANGTRQEYWECLANSNHGFDTFGYCKGDSQ